MTKSGGGPSRARTNGVAGHRHVSTYPGDITRVFGDTCRNRLFGCSGAWLRVVSCWCTARTTNGWRLRFEFVRLKGVSSLQRCVRSVVASVLCNATSCRVAHNVAECCTGEHPVTPTRSLALSLARCHFLTLQV